MSISPQQFFTPPGTPLSRRSSSSESNRSDEIRENMLTTSAISNLAYLVLSRRSSSSSIDSNFSESSSESEEYFDALEYLPHNSDTFLDQSLPEIAEGPRPCHPNTINMHQLRVCIKSVYKALCNGEDHESLHYVSRNGRYLSFELQEFPGIILKTCNYKVPSFVVTSFPQDGFLKQMQARYNNTEKIRQELATGNYPHIYLPLYCLCYAENRCSSYLVEERFSFYSDTQLRSVIKMKNKELQPAFEELTHLIIETGLDCQHQHFFSVLYLNDQWTIVLTNGCF